MRKGLAMTLVAAALVLGAGSTVQAQAQPGGRGPGGGMRGGMMASPEQMNEVLFKGLELSADQKTQVTKVHEHFQPQLTKMREDMRAAMQTGQRDPEMMRKMQQLNQAQMDSLRSVLTDAQKPTFDQNLTEMRARRGGPGGGRPPLRRSEDVRAPR